MVALGAQRCESSKKASARGGSERSSWPLPVAISLQFLIDAAVLSDDRQHEQQQRVVPTRSAGGGADGARWTAAVAGVSACLSRAPVATAHSRLAPPSIAARLAEAELPHATSAAFLVCVCV